MAVGSWDKEGIIDIVDGQLKRPQKKEQDIHGRKVINTMPRLVIVTNYYTSWI